METNEPKTNVEQFAMQVEKLSKELLGENEGFVLLAYKDNGDGTQSNFHLRNGKLANTAEAIYRAAIKDISFANIVLASGNAYAQMRQQEIMAEMAATQTEAPKKKRNKKKVS